MDGLRGREVVLRHLLAQNGSDQSALTLIHSKVHLSRRGAARRVEEVVQCPYR